MVGPNLPWAKTAEYTNEKTITGNIIRYFFRQMLNAEIRSVLYQLCTAPTSREDYVPGLEGMG